MRSMTLSGTNTPSSSPPRFWQAPADAAVTGALFTTVVDGSIVNANVQYPSKCDVYLNGGPGRNAPAGAAGLPGGDYYFQVTDPNGGTLLSTDVVSNRRLHVSSNGVFGAYSGFGGPSHPTGIDQNHPELGAITVRLANRSEERRVGKECRSRCTPY